MFPFRSIARLLEGVVYELRMIREALEVIAYRKQDGA